MTTNKKHTNKKQSLSKLIKVSVLSILFSFMGVGLTLSCIDRSVELQEIRFSQMLEDREKPTFSIQHNDHLFTVHYKDGYRVAKLDGEVLLFSVDGDGLSGLSWSEFVDKARGEWQEMDWRGWEEDVHYSDMGEFRDVPNGGE